MPALLITQCLQNDFVKPLKHDEPLPNLLHIGHHESIRLLGMTLTKGPLHVSWHGRSLSQPTSSASFTSRIGMTRAMLYSVRIYNSLDIIALRVRGALNLYLIATLRGVLSLIAQR